MTTAIESKKHHEQLIQEVLDKGLVTERPGTNAKGEHYPDIQYVGEIPLFRITIPELEDALVKHTVKEINELLFDDLFGKQIEA